MKALKKAENKSVHEEDWLDVYSPVILKLANLSRIETVTEKSADSISFMVDGHEFAVRVDNNLIDVDTEIAKAKAQLQHLEGFLKRVKAKLGNQNFVSRAPEAVVNRERKKQSDTKVKIKTLKEMIAELEKNR